jgi:SAM-dependent methyltransferase
MTTAPHWSESFFGSLYMRFDELRAEDLSRVVAGIIRLAEISSRTRVVELCCGYGRLLIPLVATTGAKATGIDKSHSLLLAAKVASREQGVAVRWVEADLRRYEGRNESDVAYLAATSFGYYDDAETNRQILRAARSCLKTSGTFLLEQANRPRVRALRREDGQFIYEMQSEFDPSSRRFSGSYRYIDKISRKVFHYPFSLILYRHTELVELLTASGFGMFRLYSGLGGRPFTENSKRLVIVCRAIE